MGCQQSISCFLYWQTPPVARHRNEAHIACFPVKDNLIEQTSNTCTSPALGTVEPTGTIQRRLQFITRRNKFLVEELARCCDSAIKREPPRLYINRTRLISDPT